MDASAEPGFVAGLATEFRERLEALDRERNAIRLALSALEGAAPASRPRLQDRLLNLIGDRPGIRGSHLALELGVGADSVSREIDRLHHAGAVARDGLGWALRECTSPEESP